MRCFVAIELPDDVRTALSAVSARLRRCPVNASWVRAEQMHLTLRFLGECSEEHVSSFAASLRERLAGVVMFNVSVHGVGAFPTIRKPSVLWVGVGAVTGALACVQANCEDSARAIGSCPETRPFHPHITLARIRDHRPRMELTHAIELEQAFDAGEFVVPGVSLFVSELTPRGPAYSRLEEFRFE